ncbi:hypothetical protein [Microbacterium sp. No. 7]|uniref:hypothetical protein n=1 Tax=Microbacterium sp. No. 7 TaxID=1714373 RepID=UPI0006D17722|nr:hypothetical protein [Microbacterium sp. No. 7]ALJ19117.1 hypothetical protein AOA12_04045 [Microbacterium sp. No. 7]
MSDPRIEPPSPDVVSQAQDAVLPGAHRGGYRRELTGPVDIVVPVHVDPSDVPDVRWAPPPAPPPPRSAGWSLMFAVLALLVSLLVGWGFLIGMLAVGLAIAALRRPWERRGIAIWALCLGILSLVYSAGWLWWASTQGPLFGG